jgi:hypothetical protein
MNPVGVRKNFSLPCNAIANGHAARFVQGLRWHRGRCRVFNNNRTGLCIQHIFKYKTNNLREMILKKFLLLEYQREHTNRRVWDTF